MSSDLCGLGGLMKSLSRSHDDSSDAEDRIEQDSGKSREYNDGKSDVRQPLQLKEKEPSSAFETFRISQAADRDTAEWGSQEKVYDEIIQEARNAASVSDAQVGYRDKRTEKIIKDALRERASRNAKLRSTDEVLQLAQKVLGRKTSEKVTEQENEQHFMSPNVSDCGASVDDFEKAVARLPSKLSSSSNISREVMLNKIDGIEPTCKRESENPPNTPSSVFGYMWGSNTAPQPTPESPVNDTLFEESVDRCQGVFGMASKLSTGDTKSPIHSQIEKMTASMADPRMPSWISQRLGVLFPSSTEEVEQTSQGQWEGYLLEESRTVIVHEIVRGNWTWCTAWSPDGNYLAIATENHHLAVVETAGSTVWRVKYDRRTNSTTRKDSPSSIRAIAWGSHFIAVGGTGNTVSILAPFEPYPVVHTIEDTGFVGSLHWKPDSTVLAIGSRDDKCLIVKVEATDADGSHPPGRGRRIDSTVLHSISRVDWANAACFSPGGNFLAVGDRSGKVAVYAYEETYEAPSTVSQIAKFLLEDAALTVEWSQDAKYLYAGGEDLNVTVVDTASWKIVARIPRERWVQFIASSHMGTHIAVGGVASEVTILDTHDNWEPVMKVELKGLVPLSAKWHPKDQFLVLTGQNNSVLAIETTGARLLNGFSLRSISPICAVAFSPDRLVVAVGNDAGIVSFYRLSETNFTTCYEMVLAEGDSQAIEWSACGTFVIVGSTRSIVVLGRSMQTNCSEDPLQSFGFSISKVIRCQDEIQSLSIDGDSNFVSVGGSTTRILDVANDFSCVREWKNGLTLANAWSPDGTWLATIGQDQTLTIYDTSNVLVGQWRIIFSLPVEEVGLALSWAPMDLDGLQYLAYGGEGQKVTVIEVRTQEETWETVLEIPRAGVVYDLDWNCDGILAVAVGDGTVTILDLGYLRSGWAVNEMDYTWQRQGIVCSVELRRNLGANSMRRVRWMPSHDDSGGCFLAVGGTDGALEVVDLTERERCKGFCVADNK